MTQNGGKGAGGNDADALRRERLHRFLCELVEREGRMEATELLGVNYRTLVKAEKSGEMTGRMSDALERLLLTWDGGAGADDGAEDVDPDPESGGELARRVEALEAGLEELTQELRGGLEAIRVAVEGTAKGDPASRAGKPAAQARAKPGNKGAPSQTPQTPQTPPTPPVAGLGTSRPARRRRVDPEMVTREPAEDDPEVYGDAWPLVQEYRKLRDGHPRVGKGLSWLTVEERLLIVELAMLEEHGLTLPPETEPLRGLDRGAQLNWRLKALHEFRKRRARLELLRRLRWVFSPGLWRK